MSEIVETSDKDIVLKKLIIEYHNDAEVLEIGVFDKNTNTGRGFYITKTQWEEFKRKGDKVLKEK